MWSTVDIIWYIASVLVGFGTATTMILIRITSNLAEK